MSWKLREMAHEKAHEVVRQAVDDFLSCSLSRHPQNLVRKVVEYTVISGGHRWRPLVAVSAGLIFDPEPLQLVLPGACGIELAHAASLILDDLPSMDDAALRRGRPCPHLVFERWAVDLAPIFMVTLAYRLSLDNHRVAADKRIQTALTMSIAGLDMIAGQVMDMEHDNKDSQSHRLIDCYSKKCASLYAAAALTGALSVGAKNVDAEILFKCGMYLGLAYQYSDDLADVVATEEETLKTVGQDTGKKTAVDLYGLDGTRGKITQFRETALAKLKGYGTEANLLRSIICSASWET